MELEIKEWLEDLSNTARITLLLNHDIPDDCPEYDLGYKDGTTTLAHRILSVLERIERESE